jgi:hypothetical protein
MERSTGMNRRIYLENWEVKVEVMIYGVSTALD